LLTKPSAKRAPPRVVADRVLLQQAAGLHVGSFSLRHEPARSATLAAVLMARRAGIPVPFDPNLRISFWASHETLKEQTLRLWQIADVIKV
jgi:sugar/nucleoside kinase (ribokinase family)